MKRGKPGSHQLSQLSIAALSVMSPPTPKYKFNLNCQGSVVVEGEVIYLVPPTCQSTNYCCLYIHL